MAQYQPEPLPSSVDRELAEWLNRELMRIGNAFLNTEADMVTPVFPGRVEIPVGPLVLGIEGVAGIVPFLQLTRRASGTSETIGVSDGAGGFRGLLGYGSSDLWYMRMGDISNDDFIFTSDGISAFGGQIAFPATENPSANPNAFTDSEKGLWTPALSFNTASVGMTYLRRSGFYTKHNNVVTAPFEVFLSAKGSSVGAATLSGLPFVSSTLQGDYGVFFLWYQSMAGVVAAPHGVANLNSTMITLNQGGAVSVAPLLDTNFTNASRLIGTVVYRTP